MVSGGGKNHKLIMERVFCMRLIIAFITAPIFPGTVLLFFSLITSNANEGLWIFTFSALVGYVVTIVLGVPAYALMKKHGLNRLREYFIGGLLLSIAPIIYFIFVPKFSAYEGAKIHMPHVGLVLLFVMASVSATCVFWLIARPDLRVKRL